MTRYTVIWHDSALAKLAKLWNESLDRRGISAAADRIDALLRVDAGSRGAAESAGTRKLVIHPLAVLFRFREDDRIVEVINIKIDASQI
jgi:plasmid stabilization system protein ParE